MEEVYLKGMVNKMYEKVLLREEQSVNKNSLLKQVAEDFKLNANFIFSFGVGISGFIGPVKTLLENKGLNITEYDVTLIIITVCYILLTKSNEDIHVLMSELKKRRLDGEVKGVLNFMTKSLSLVKVVGKKVGVVVNNLLDVLAFTFLSLPIMDLIKDFADNKGFSINRVDDLLLGVSLSASTYAIKNLIKKK
jgi:hypothetical protein